MFHFFIVCMACVLVFFVSYRDCTLKVWNFEVLSDNDGNQTTDLKPKAVVKGHDKEINSLAVAPNDALVCSGSQVCDFAPFCFLHSRIRCYANFIFHSLGYSFLNRTKKPKCGGFLN